MGSPFVGGEEDGIERYHFVHRDGIVTRWCRRIRMGESAGKAGEEGVELRVDRLRVGRGRPRENLVRE